MARILQGTVISARMNKTIIVQVVRKFTHPRYRKVLVRHKKYKVHCEDAEVKPGDVVLIKETLPISKEKHFIVIREKEEPIDEVKKAPEKRIEKKKVRKTAKKVTNENA